MLLRSLRASQSHVGSDVSVDQVIALGATGFRMVVKGSALGPLLQVYNNVLCKAFITGAVFAGLSFLSSCLMEFWKMDSERNEGDGSCVAEGTRHVSKSG